MYTEKTDSDLEGHNGVAQRYESSIRERLHLARIAVNSALADDDIRTALNRFGYDESVLKNGHALLEQTERVVHDHRIRYGQEPAAAALISAAMEQADRAYYRALILARIAFKDEPEAERELNLSGRRKSDFDGWQRALRGFYETLLARPDWLASMERFRYDRARAMDDLALVKIAIDLHEDFIQAPGPAPRHARLREARLEEVHEWMSDFKDIAFVALEEKPELLEKLGFVMHY